MRLVIAMAAIEMFERGTTSPWSGVLAMIARLLKRLNIKERVFSFHNELNAIASGDGANGRDQLEKFLVSQLIKTKENTQA